MDRKKLAYLLMKYHKVVLLLCSEEYLKQLLFLLHFPKDNDVCIITMMPCSILKKKIPVEMVTEEEAEELKKLYSMYEFSDNFLVLDEDNTLYATVFEFVRAGILTCEEAWRAFMYRK